MTICICRPEHGDLPLSEIDGILEAFHLHTGSIVAEKRTLPTAVREAMTSHHAPEAAPEELQPSIAAAAVGDFLAGYFTTNDLRVVSAELQQETAQAMAGLEAARLIGLSREECSKLVALGPKAEAFAKDFLD